MTVTTHYNPALREAHAKIHGACLSDDQWEWTVAKLLRSTPQLRFDQAEPTLLTIEDSTGRTRIFSFRG